MPQDDLEETQRRINALKVGLDALTDRTFAYFTAVFQLLEDKGLVDPKEMIRRLEWHKKQYAKTCRDLEFYNLMQEQFGEDDPSPPAPSL